MILQLPYSPADSWSRWSAGWLITLLCPTSDPGLFIQQNIIPRGQVMLARPVPTQRAWGGHSGLKPVWTQGNRNQTSFLTGRDRAALWELQYKLGKLWTYENQWALSWKNQPFQGDTRNRMTPKPYSIESVSTRESIPQRSRDVSAPPHCCLPWRAESQELQEEEGWLSIFGQELLEETKDGDSAPQ